jgi:hypothetical protein
LEDHQAQFVDNGGQLSAAIEAPDLVIARSLAIAVRAAFQSADETRKFLLIKKVRGRAGQERY